MRFITQNPIKSLIFLAIFIKFSPLDYMAFRFLNNSLLLSISFAKMMAYLNHKNETFINIILMLSINLIAIKDIENKKLYLKRLFFAIVLLEIAILMNNVIFSKILNIHRPSPTMIHSKYVSLKLMFNMENIKIISGNSFPGGHSFVAIYWALISLYLIPRKYTAYVIIVAFVVSISRLFSGAHWLSDVVGTSAISLLWYKIYLSLNRFISGYQLSKFRLKYF